MTRGSHRYVHHTSTCDGDQSGIKESRTQTSNDQGIKKDSRHQSDQNQDELSIYLPKLLLVDFC